MGAESMVLVLISPPLSPESRPLFVHMMCGCPFIYCLSYWAENLFFGKGKTLTNDLLSRSPPTRNLFSVCTDWWWRDTIVHIRVRHLREKSIIKVSLLHDLFFSKSKCDARDTRSLTSQTLLGILSKSSGWDGEGELSPCFLLWEQD